MSNPHFMYSLLGTYERFENTALIQTQILEDHIKTDFEEMRRIEKDKLARIKEFSHHQNTSNSWAYLSAVANNVTSLIPLVSGLALSRNKETRTPGLLLVGSGVASIANRIFQSNGIYDKISTWLTSSQDMQETIASRLETGMQYASYVAGLAGYYLDGGTSTLTEKLTSWATTGAALATQGIHFGQSFAEKQIRYTKADVQIAESQIQQRFQNIHQTAKESERLTHTIADIAEALKSAIQSLYTRV